jgi:predicted nucleic acid-binding protein
MIIDANVAIYWCVQTPLTSAAKPVAQRTDLCAPHLIKLETANALLKYLRTGLITNRQFHDSFDIVQDAVSEFVDDSSLLRGAAEIAASHSHKIYDCLYLALALQRREPIATADRLLAVIAKALDVETHLVEAS